MNHVEYFLGLFTQCSEQSRALPRRHLNTFSFLCDVTESLFLMHVWVSLLYSTGTSQMLVCFCPFADVLNEKPEVMLNLSEGKPMRCDQVRYSLQESIYSDFFLTQGYMVAL